MSGIGVPPLPFTGAVYSSPRSPLPFTKRRVGGTYRSAGTPFQVELRVDVDGVRPTKRVSADYYLIAGATTTYFGSMRVDAATVTVTFHRHDHRTRQLHVGRGRPADQDRDPAR